MSSCGGFDCTPASLRLIVSSVMRLRLHLNLEFILVCALRDRPFQRGERSHRDAADMRDIGKDMSNGSYASWKK